jgi:hypothetical protein
MLAAWPAVCVDGGVVFLMALMLGMDGSIMAGTMYLCSLSNDRQHAVFVCRVSSMTHTNGFHAEMHHAVHRSHFLLLVVNEMPSCSL